MSIDFLPNDPLAEGAPPLRTKGPRPDRPANRAGFTFTNGLAEGQFPLGSPGFLFWQCREACLAAVATFESFAGNHVQWGPDVPDRRRLPVLQNAGMQLNAFYDRNSVSFFEFTTGAKTTLGGQSTDVVVHEVGHALLDSLRPELFDGFFIEVGAFHEAFGDCMALLTGLADQKTRKAMVASPQILRRENFLETLMEDLSDGVAREKGSKHPASKPRHALNDFQWKLPSTLPTTGPPNILIGEIHSFGRIFVGCFYDVICNIFKAGSAGTEAALSKAALTAAKLLVTAAKTAPVVTRFFQSVGRAMVLADQKQNNGANRDSIRAAFERHGVALGAAAMLAPTAALNGTLAPIKSVKNAVLSMAIRKDLMNRISGKTGAKMAVSATNLFGQRLAHVSYQHEIPLGKLSKKLSGVVCRMDESVLVGSEGGRAAVMGALPETSATEDEVSAYVKTLLAHDRIIYGAQNKGAIAIEDASQTHVIEARGGKKVLRRIRFLCGPSHASKRR